MSDCNHVSSKHLVTDWETATTYVATYDSGPNGDEQGACDVEVQIGTDGTRWYTRTTDDGGGSDDCDDTAYATREAAESAASDFAAERDEGDGDNAAGYLAAQLADRAGDPDADGRYCVYWETVGDDEHPCRRYATLDQAQAAAAIAQEELEARHPGGLLCGYSVRVLDEDGDWVAIDEDAR